MNNFLGIKFKALKLAQTSSTPIYFEGDIDMAFSFSSKMRSPDGLHWSAEIPLVSDFSVVANVGTVVPFSAEITGDSALTEGACELIPSDYIGSSEFASRLIVQAQMSTDSYNTVQSVITIIDEIAAQVVVYSAENIKSDITVTTTIESVIRTPDALCLDIEIPLVSDLMTAMSDSASLSLNVEITGKVAFIGCASKLVLSLPFKPTEWASQLTVTGQITIGNYKLIKSSIAIADSFTIKPVLYSASNLKAEVDISNSVEADVGISVPLSCSILSESSLTLTTNVDFADSLYFGTTTIDIIVMGSADAVIESACNIGITQLNSSATLAATIGLLKHLQLSDLANKTLVELAQFNLKDMHIVQI